MGKTLQYVSEFTFPSEKGFTGSAGKAMDKGYARGGAALMKKADGGPIKNDGEMRGNLTDTEMRVLARENARRGMGGNLTDTEMRALARENARRGMGGNLTDAEMRALAREQPGYKKGGMPARKQYPVDRREPMIAMAKGGMTKLGEIPASPAPKSDMLYSKKENTAKTLLADGKGAPMPHAKGSVNMKRGGMAMGGMSKVGKVMGEYKAGDLHSGSKSGPVVKSRKQAVAIGMSEARKAAKK
jgi:hypothetical protein